MSGEMTSGKKSFPLCNRKRKPTKSDTIVDDRDHVFKEKEFIFFVLLEKTFVKREFSTYEDFQEDRLILILFFNLLKISHSKLLDLLGKEAKLEQIFFYYSL